MLGSSAARDCAARDSDCWMASSASLTRVMRSGARGRSPACFKLRCSGDCAKAVEASSKVSLTRSMVHLRGRRRRECGEQESLHAADGRAGVGRIALAVRKDLKQFRASYGMRHRAHGELQAPQQFDVGQIRKGAVERSQATLGDVREMSVENFFREFARFGEEPAHDGCEFSRRTFEHFEYRADEGVEHLVDRKRPLYGGGFPGTESR